MSTKVKILGYGVIRVFLRMYLLRPKGYRSQVEYKPAMISGLLRKVITWYAIN